jgi:hypothetical protein
MNHQNSKGGDEAKMSCTNPPSDFLFRWPEFARWLSRLESVRSFETRIPIMPITSYLIPATQPLRVLANPRCSPVKMVINGQLCFPHTALLGALENGIGCQFSWTGKRKVLDSPTEVGPHRCKPANFNSIWELACRCVR